ncbi:multifunctional oxoglutarate decarboxylase/oxoglutarate dehydrogenase thiamine pyrophosphate-binding subunit/dihydrolipoyllysine-residue succinyltransferase subunit [Corynebacterium pseudodiphtheriticum]|uniref:multifunctional oxoglutarate decarboxylase/oxoglutarate dehydrogenase thiamine pyrophosphate-binding subunit/dihydrolipoyllysine-residue succinyltransferase subunit n=1 Tax=Corynebacterium pseudodiphtheriticum TaxID=37637 RepID=UPI002540BC35|nr:multifunctional oxoglutarate decarboxylase/oxoglutarate dehydrogenase thiamine pyrophosphate-binding subunit/dihydrolipoyllysine-residue succinyltransferase subunit [Corynebacterium pseudodiphtheriticum]MDK4285557.1 multifunctional oxoglutarate decarboxylase/oxoglutarate dehydrogenase thiamine pyrophosphate-binding subunit/dihydrolipoyllysine-residue succinyltransferase subunit [Corynebacterium pseudodiphtheriticum]MDK4314905.1 multifunctional oxoglutarate decarboxylase/oxoglutarate dehydrogen
MSTNNPFGLSTWLADELYQEYKKDPQSVDKEWRELFDKHGAPSSIAESSEANSEETVGTTKAQKAQGGKEAASVAPPTQKSLSHKREQRESVVEESARKAKNKAGVDKRDVAPKASKKAPSPLDELPDYEGGESKALKGMFKAIAKNMDESLEIPTATSVRDIPVKLMWENRSLINEHLKRTRGGKISFTHIIGYALVKATQKHPDMNVRYELVDGKKPTVVYPEDINLGLAIDLPQKDGSRALVVAALKKAQEKNFAEFIEAYDDIVARSRKNKLTAADFQGATINLTNPGGIGTRHSIARLTKGLGTIIGVGSMDYPAEFAGASSDRLAELGVGRLVTLTSTYDHRVIQGAESGEFLRTMSQLLVDDVFWDELFSDLQIPYEPMRWAQDIPNTGIDKSTRVMNLIEAYRSRGHLIADTNPLRWKQPGLPSPDHRDLDIRTHGLTLWDLDRTFHVGGFGGKESMTLREVLSRLRAAYTLKVGSEFTHIMDRDEREWLRDALEAGMPKPTNAEQKYILQKVNAAEAFENFLQTKYVGQKRFSLEGAEALIPLMDSVIDTAAGQDLDEVVIGMPHRGRLNVLFNIVGKPLAEVFNEFDGNYKGGQAGGSGDVKYHLGTEGEHLQMFGDGEIKVTLTANPSHLEAVNPVVVGISRAKQDILDRVEGSHDKRVVPLLLHGDASFAGLGIVQETINLMGLDAYNVGGSIHVVVNNQVGFTTTPDSGRSTLYSTDLAKGFDCPVFHVNGDDPEAVVWVGQLATEYRRRFGKDVFIDLICYRLRGHNEADDPSMTQPLMYERIGNRDSVRQKYTDELIGRGDLSEEDAEAAARDFRDQMESVFNEVKEAEKNGPQEQTGIAASQELTRGLDTSISADTLRELGEAYLNLPEGFELHDRVAPIAEKRAKSAVEGGIDWGWGELIALGSLASEGKQVRLVGEDSKRGTFTQRHAVTFNPNTAEQYNPLHALAQETGNGGSFETYNSALTEFAGLGVEYGYSVGNLDAVVAWEAQFGDFVNGAQTIIDEYVCSGEAKWGQLSKVILLLPHGYEGQGPDHSSARIERFLQLAAEGSMTIAQPSTPANHFHLLRRHALGTMSRPLVVFTPKSMLRAKAATSEVAEFTEVTSFRSVINDPRLVDADNNVIGDADKVKTVMLCSGKVYYELEKRRQKDEREDIAIVRIEMLHPIPFNRLSEAFDSFPNLEEIRFVQDEPANQGPWPFYNEHLHELIPDMPRMRRISRRAQSSTATGIAKVHQLEQKQLIDEAFAD